jgi:hypothetical protein
VYYKIRNLGGKYKHFPYSIFWYTVTTIISLIDKKGYVTEREIIIYLSNVYQWEITEIQLRKMRGQIEKLGYKRKRSNKELKLKYNISGEGYPVIIVKSTAN